MPSAPYFASLFAVGPDLWSYPAWQERTKFIVHPFASDATPALTGLTLNELSAVKEFAQRIHSLSTHAAMVDALNKARHNDTEGRRVWNSWLDSNFASWKISPDLDAILMEEGRHPRQLINTQGFVSAHTL